MTENESKHRETSSQRDPLLREATKCTLDITQTEGESILHLHTHQRANQCVCCDVPSLRDRVGTVQPDGPSKPDGPTTAN